MIQLLKSIYQKYCTCDLNLHDVNDLKNNNDSRIEKPFARVVSMQRAGDKK